MERRFKCEVDLQDFQVVYDYDKIKSEMENEKQEDFEDMCYTSVGDYDGRLSPEECVRNIDSMINSLEIAVQPEYLKEVVEGFPKKKDGTFKKNQTHVVATSDNSYYEDESYGYRTNSLRFKAIDHTTLQLQYVSTVIGY